MEDPSDWLIETATGARLIVIDTLSRFHMLDENESSDAKLLMRRMEHIAYKTGAAVLFLHHVNKGSVAAKTIDQQQAARGSSVLIDDARWSSFLAVMTEKEAATMGYDDVSRRKYVRWNISKQNYSAPIPDVWLERKAGGILVKVEHIQPVDAACAEARTRYAAEDAARAYAQASNGGVSNEKTDFDF